MINFGEINDRYGPNFAADLLDQFTLKWADGPATTNLKRSMSIRRWLRDLDDRADRKDVAPALRSVRDKLKDCEYRAIEQVEFEHALNDFLSRATAASDRTIFRTDTVVSRRRLLEQLRAALNQLAPAIGWPNYEFTINLNQPDRGTTPSIGELELPPGKKDSHSDSTLGQFAITVARNKERLDRLRKLLEGELLRLYEIFKHGQALLARADLPSDVALFRAEKELDGVVALKDRRSPLPWGAEECFPSDDPEYALASLLKHIKVNHGGRVSGALDWSTLGIRQLVTRHGGVRSIAEFLEASPRALVCAYVITMIESAFNVQPCDDLSATPFAGAIKGGRIDLHILTSTKNRPEPRSVKALISDGSVSTKAKDYQISGKQAIEIFLEMSAPIRQRAVEESRARESQGAYNPEAYASAPRSDRLGGARVQDYLWILPTGTSNAGEIRRSAAGNFRDWWKALLDDFGDDPIIGGLQIRRKHIRPTVIQLRATTRDGDVALASMVAGHASEDTTWQNYLNRPYIKARLADEIREFQVWLEAAIIAKPKKMAPKLGYSVKELMLLREKAADAGLAFYEEISLSEPEFSKSSPTEPVNPILYSDTNEGLRSAALLRISLDEAWEEFFNLNPKRWYLIWFPLHALSIAVCNLLAAGPRRRQFRQVYLSIKEDITAGRLLPFRPQ